MSQAEAIDRVFDALSSGDVESARACYTPDARIWHNFDGVVVDVDSVIASWKGLIAHFPERSTEDVRRQPTADGFVQQHMMVLRTAGGERKGWPVCIVVRMKDGLIAELHEYIDRAGALKIAEGPVTTPGL